MYNLYFILYESSIHRKIQGEMKKVRRQMTEIDRDNLHLNAMLEDLHVSVSERRNIQDTHIQVW